MTNTTGTDASGDATGTDDLPVDAVIDTHVHFWDHSLEAEGFRWPWLEPGFQHRKVRGTHELDAPRYTVPEFRKETAGAGVAGIVNLHATELMDHPERETAWAERMADEHGWPNAIVGACPLRRPETPDILRRQARHERLRGVRDMWDKKGLERASDVEEAFEVAAELGLSVELRLPLDRFRVLCEIAEAWPAVTLVLSHAGLPLERTPENHERWRASVRDLAQAPNVVCKISAVAGASDPDWTLDSIRPWILGCVEAFGPERCMLASNWPVDRMHTSYHELIDAYRAITAELSPHERARIFHGTAAEVYGIPLTSLTPL